MMDVISLQTMGITTLVGNWWLDSNGTYGAVGSCVPLGNIRMQALATPTSGGARTWSTSMGHYGGSDGQGFSYVGGHGWSYYTP
jgi:hypothetical protein